MVSLKDLKSEDEVLNELVLEMEKGIDNTIITYNKGGRKWKYIYLRDICDSEKYDYDIKKKAIIKLARKYLENGIDIDDPGDGTYRIDWTNIK